MSGLLCLLSTEACASFQLNSLYLGCLFLFSLKEKHLAQNGKIIFRRKWSNFQKMVLFMVVMVEAVWGLVCVCVFSTWGLVCVCFLAKESVSLQLIPL